MTQAFITKAALPLALLTLGACGGGPTIRDTYGAPPRSFEGFPAESWTEAANGQAFVNVEASFVGNHKRMLGTDLTKKGILPIRLTLGLRGEHMSNAQIRLDSDQMNLRMYLPDGTVLVPATLEEVEQAAGKSRREKVIAHSLEAGVLQEYGLAKEKEQFVFFKLNLKDLQLQGSRLSFGDGEQTKFVDLTSSLLAFNVMLENNLEPFTVGVKSK